VAITKRKTSSGAHRWRVTYRDAGGVQRSGGTYTTESEANDVYRTCVGDVAREKRSGSRRVPWLQEVRGGVTVAGFCWAWLESAAANHQLGLRTVENYSFALRTYVLPRWGGTALSAITRAGVRTWLTELEQAGRGHATLALIRTCMSSVLTSALDEGLIKSHPVRGIRLPKKSGARPVPPTASEYRKLLTELPKRYKLLAELMWVSGVRTGEGLALTAGDIDGPTLHITKTMVELRGPARFEIKPFTKNGDHRSVRIPADLADRLRAAGDGGGLIFTNTAGKTPSRSGLSEAWKKAAQRAGIPASRRHDLRHAHASFIANNPDIPLWVAMERLGHRSILTTQAYVHEVSGIASDGRRLPGSAAMPAV